MLFNSIEFAIFLPLVFVLHWFLASKDLKLQNLLLLLFSYVFYGSWDWRFLSLIIISTLVDFTVGLGLYRYKKRRTRKILLGISIFTNLTILGFFKYFNFFLVNFINTFSFLGHEIQANTLNIILPVGISFYTFQTLSYTIDVYRKKIEPTNDYIAFAAFVAFFPQLVAGPIERAKNLLPQLKQKRIFEYTKAVNGLRQILWGLFKKMVIADNCAFFADRIFSNYDQMNGSTLVLGVIFFAFQIYGDFSGYSDIAIGVAKLFGINLIRNFAFPYFSRDIAEFWRRWHISLTTWFRDYLYIPLGGSRGNFITKLRNIFIIFIVSGFWHGANWTFILWGALNALLFLPLIMTNTNRKHLNIVADRKMLPSLKEFFQIITTFGVTSILWIFFRAENINHALGYLSGIFSLSLFELPGNIGWKNALITSILLVAFIIIEWSGRDKEYAIEKLGFHSPKLVRWGYYLIIVFLIFFYQGDKQEFIYFQF